MRGGVLAQALSSQTFRQFSAIFRFVFSLSYTFFERSLLKYSYSLAILASALGVATAALQRGSLAPKPLAQRHGRQPPEERQSWNFSISSPPRRHCRTLQVRTYYRASQLATTIFWFLSDFVWGVFKFLRFRIWLREYHVETFWGVLAALRLLAWFKKLIDRTRNSQADSYRQPD
jgi:hypothetical protein